jgi:tetratricopeptide (TPR) repeat protein
MISHNQTHSELSIIEKASIWSELLHCSFRNFKTHEKQMDKIMNAEFFFNQGVIKSKNKDLSGAIEDYSMAIKLSQGTERKNLTTDYGDGMKTHVSVYETTEGHINIYFSRAGAYFDLGNYASAIDDFSKILEFEKTDSEVYFRRATCWYCMENDQNAFEDLSIANRLNPKYTKEVFLRQFGG